MNPLPSEALRAQQASKARSLLRTLAGRVDCVRSSAVVTFDGLMLASVLADGVGGDRFGAMCASLLALSTRAAKEVERGELRQVILDGRNGPMLLSRAGNLGVLAVAADPTPNLGRLILEAKTTATALAELYEAPGE